VNHHKQTTQEDMSEFMMTGLRLTREGISEEDFQTRFGRSVHDVYANEIDELIRLGLLEKITEADDTSSLLRITRRGRLLGNQVFMRFV
jgi:oxygen-independent coproporphyrinogen-3 oxidase